MKTIKTKGIIIKEYSVGESDKFLSMFTKSNGKVMANAPLAKRYNRGLASATQVFVYGEFVLQENKNSYKLIHADIIETFYPLGQDLFKLSYGAYILEFIDLTMETNLYAPEVLRLIVRTLQAMCKDTIESNLIRHIFELKHMCLIGFMPNLFSCTLCGIAYEECQEIHFDVRQGGILCQECTRPSPLRFNISGGTLHTMQYIVTIHIDQLFTFTVSDKVLFEFSKIMAAYISYYIDKQFKTLNFIQDIE